jgi:hypothetical protein
MFEILAHTPFFVYVLFVVLVVFGFMQSRNRKVNIFLAYLLPFFMVCLSLLGVLSSFGIKFIPLSIWLGGLLVISFAFYRAFPLKGIIYYSSENKLFIPGSWIPFMVIMAIFFTKYVVGVMNGLQIPLVHDSNFIMLLSLIYGCFSGYFVSRALSLIQAKQKSEKNI